MDDSKHTLVIGILRPDSDDPAVHAMPNEPRHRQRERRREGDVRVCYEAGPPGDDLYRQVATLGVPCPGMTPSRTPRNPGDRLKIDRRDVRKLVRLFRSGDLTSIAIPDAASEAGRDLRRCREALLRWRHRLGKFLARHGRIYREGRNWTRRHWAGIRAQHLALPVLARTSEEDGGTVEPLLARVAARDREIAALAEIAAYHALVGGLRGFRGIATLVARGLRTELGALSRFPRPRQLLAVLGLVPSEDSSGARECRGSITTAGTAHMRRLLVEAGWQDRHPPRLGATLARELGAFHWAALTRGPALQAACWLASALAPEDPEHRTFYS